MTRFLRSSLFLVIALLSMAYGANAQVFSTQHDTVTASVSYSTSLVNAITPTNKNIQIVWKVTATDFPANWSGGNLSISDNQYSYSNTAGLLWNGTSGTAI